MIYWNRNAEKKPDSGNYCSIQSMPGPVGDRTLLWAFFTKFLDLTRIFGCTLIETKARQVKNVH